MKTCFGCASRDGNLEEQQNGKFLCRECVRFAARIARINLAMGITEIDQSKFHDAKMPEHVMSIIAKDHAAEKEAEDKARRHHQCPNCGADLKNS